MPSAIIHIPTDARREARAVLGRSTADSMLKKFHRMLKSKTDGRYDGTFKGFFHIDGKTITILDLPGFAEKVYNRW